MQKSLLPLRRAKYFFAGQRPAWSQPPYPPCPKEDLEPLSKPLANRWQEDVIDSGQKAPSIKVLVWLSSFRPCGIRHLFPTSPLSPPLGKGLT